MSESSTETSRKRHRPHVRFAGRRIHLPGNPFARMVLGTALCFGGMLWFLPVLGLWMLPLGLLVLSVDVALIRRWRRRGQSWWGRRKSPRGANRHSKEK